MIFGLIRCLIAQHEPHRRRVNKIGANVYIGYCVHCGAPIRRLRRNDWVRDWKRTFRFGRPAPDSEATLDPDFDEN